MLFELRTGSKISLKVLSQYLSQILHCILPIARNARWVENQAAVLTQ